MWVLDQAQKMSNLESKAQLLNARGCPGPEELRRYATTLIGGWATFQFKVAGGEQALPGSDTYEAERLYLDKHRELEPR